VFVPGQFWDEMTELLITALKRKRLKHADALEINRLLAMYDITTEAFFERDHIERILDLAGLYDLSAAEASYLELAVRKNALLGTLNGNLIAACQKAGVAVLL
jgi:predicted nucleic acid-binding protein